ncbi:hypothetical protein NDK47_11350 [Brevibacillus ruminantium]|uniref:Tetratricopeptide repeat protein n=1 Tax=Brevibacillus ruminantium TaxID=2950604 RepID=A0ABY4WMC5_9BACL|nr:hypothetical protein [Brevibacillus ruminantium]USG67829.1 hypothetical protein NDK47_11350 [Brevibacillus ruminantium]
MEKNLHYMDFLQPNERINYYYRMGVHADILDYHGECIDFCGRSIREDQADSSQKAYALITLFNAYISLDDLILAEYCLKEYENSRYADFRKKHFRAVLYTKRGRFAEAIQLYKECLQEAERDRRISVVSDLLEVYLEIGRNDLIKELIDSEADFLPANINIHPYRIKVAARYFKRKGVCQLSAGLTNEGFDSLLQSITYYRQLGDSEKAMQCIGLFLRHHRLSGKSLSFEHMEKIDKICHNEANE